MSRSFSPVSRPHAASRRSARMLACMAVAGLLSASAAMAKSELDGWYALGDFGQSKFSMGGHSETDTSFSFGAGYRLTPQVGAELSYRSLGNLGSTSISAIQGAVVGALPVQGPFGVYGKVGLGRLDGDKAYWRPAFGFGAQFELTPQWRLRAGYERYTKVEGVTTSMWTAGANFRF